MICSTGAFESTVETESPVCDTCPRLNDMCCMPLFLIRNGFKLLNQTTGYCIAALASYKSKKAVLVVQEVLREQLGAPGSG